MVDGLINDNLNATYGMVLLITGKLKKALKFKIKEFRNLENGWKIKSDFN
jgi:hypothetical protein